MWNIYFASRLGNEEWIKGCCFNFCDFLLIAPKCFYMFKVCCLKVNNALICVLFSLTDFVLLYNKNVKVA